MKYCNSELNMRIREICDDGCEKTIPYIGWFWRNFNFDSMPYTLGVIPADAEGLSENYVGFMQNNKWGYPYLEMNTEESLQLLFLIEAAVDSPCDETLSKVREFMQSLGRKKKYVSFTETHWYEVNDGQA